MTRKRLVTVTGSRRRVIAMIAAIVLAAIVLVAPGGTPSATAKDDDALARSKKLTETYQSRLETAVPYPLAAMRDSIERRNLRERLLRFNQANKIGYVYLLANTGSVIAFYTISGKVSSTESQLTATQIENLHGNNDSRSGTTIEAPGDDGSYGPNEQGIFFFTTEGVMIQWSGQYLYTDAPLRVTSAPVVVLDAGAKPSSTGDSPTKP